MKTIKLIKALIYVLIIMAVSSGVFAQDKDSKVQKTPEERAKISAEKMKSSLNLNDEQYSKIYDLNLQRAKDFKALKENKSKLREDIKKLRTDYHSSLKNILTDEQYNKMKEMHKDRKNNKNKKGHHSRKYNKEKK